ncbi:MAG: hypothetical protein JO104_08145 [Candidatus Eremiobacteraeota bacterium]|nr:hypothetical protein [Candidatus Eremiobacteraeota bacterium]
MKALNAAPQPAWLKLAAPSRQSVIALSGLAMLGLAVVLVSTSAQVTLETGMAIGAVLLGLAGLAVFNVSLIMQVGGRDRALAAANEQLNATVDRLLERTGVLETAKRRSDSFLNSVPARLLVIDAESAIEEAFSGDSAELFPTTTGETFATALRRLVPEATFEATREHLRALFDASNDEKNLAAVNPLRSVRVTVAGEAGTLVERGLSFAFRRVYEDGSVSRVLVAVEDTTDWLESEKRLRESEMRKGRQFETLLGILHVEPSALEEFIKNAQAELDAIDRSMRAADFSGGSSQTNVLRQRLGNIGERVEAIKEAAALLRFDYFVQLAAAHQQSLAAFKAKPVVGSEDFLQLILAHANFRAEFDDLQILRFKLSALRRAAQIQENASDEMVVSVAKLARELASELGKEISIDAEGFDSRELAPDRRLLIRDVLVELTRNAVAHGIESPGERHAAGKQGAGVIEIRRVRDALPGSFAFTFRDNGRGLDPARIRERAVELGILDAERAESMNDSDAAGYVFVPGFTTGGEILGVPARGMGLNMVKRRIVDECAGTISIDSEGGAFCEFSFVVPPHRGAVAR